MNKYQGILGILTLLAIAYAMSNNRNKINFRTVYWGLSLQVVFAIFILKTPIGKPIFSFMDKIITKLISFSDAGSDFLFKSYIADVGLHPALLNFAFRLLPTIIFFSSLMAVLYHFGIIQIIVKWIAKLMQKTMHTSGAETLSVSANIFVGQTEAPLMVRPFIGQMTKSELMVVMVGGFATVAGGVLAIYVKWLSDIPGIAGHLLAASVMSAPAALVISKIIYPEIENSNTSGDINIEIENTSSNAMEALGDGASDGLKLAANVGAMLVAFISIVALLNYIFGIVWPILYTLMAVVSFLQAKLIYKVYVVQLILNGAWSWIFFAHQALTLALFDIIILIILNVIILHKLWTNNSYVSFFLYLPYVLWISFASYLNANIVFLN